MKCKCGKTHLKDCPIHKEITVTFVDLEVYKRKYNKSIWGTVPMSEHYYIVKALADNFEKLNNLIEER